MIIVPLLGSVNSNTRCVINSGAINLAMDKPKTKRKAKLEDWQKEDAARLKDLFAKSKKSQAEFGDDHGIGTQGAVWQYLNAVIPLNLDAALKFADGLDVSISDFSPRLADALQPLLDKELERRYAKTPYAKNTDQAGLLKCMEQLPIEKQHDLFKMGSALAEPNGSEEEKQKAG